jgi:hypothetical protein
VTSVQTIRLKIVIDRSSERNVDADLEATRTIFQQAGLGFEVVERSVTNQSALRSVRNPYEMPKHPEVTRSDLITVFYGKEVKTRNQPRRGAAFCGSARIAAPGSPHACVVMIANIARSSTLAHEVAHVLLWAKGAIHRPLRLDFDHSADPANLLAAGPGRLPDSRLTQAQVRHMRASRLVAGGVALRIAALPGLPMYDDVFAWHMEANIPWDWPTPRLSSLDLSEPAQIPEPATIFLTLLGLLVFASWRRLCQAGRDCIIMAVRRSTRCNPYRSTNNKPSSQDSPMPAAAPIVRRPAANITSPDPSGPRPTRVRPCSMLPPALRSDSRK